MKAEQKFSCNFKNSYRVNVQGFNFDCPNLQVDTRSNLSGCLPWAQCPLAVTEQTLDIPELLVLRIEGIVGPI